MTEVQRLTVRASEIRQRLNEIAGMEPDAVTPEIRSESDKLTTEYGTVETQLRAATVAEADATREAELRLADGTEDAETRALRALQGRTSMAAYLRAFADGAQLDGAARELAEHRNLPINGRVVPWDVFLPPAPPGGARGAELRADAVTPAPASGNPVNTAAIIGRVFARSATARLGVAMPTVGYGEASYPVITAGQSPEFVAADGTKEAAAGAITPNVLTPRRLQARFGFRAEDEMITPGLETGFRQDLDRAMADQLDKTVIGLGTALVRGFLAAAAQGGLADYADPSAVVDFAAAAEQAARGVDGIYASDESECTWIVGTATHRKLAALIQANDSTSASQRLRTILRDYGASANVPAAASNVQSGILAKMGAGDGEYNAVCPVWEGVQLIRDEATQAVEGHVYVTARAFHNFKVLRPDAFVRTKLKIAA